MAATAAVTSPALPVTADEVPIYAGRAGTISTASPCTTGLPLTVHTHSNLARFFSGISSATFTVVTTVIADLHRRFEVQRLRNVDGAGAR